MSLVSYSNILKNKSPSLSFSGLRTTLYRPSIATHSNARLSHSCVAWCLSQAVQNLQQNPKKKTTKPPPDSEPPMGFLGVSGLYLYCGLQVLRYWDDGIPLVESLVVLAWMCFLCADYVKDFMGILAQYLGVFQNCLALVWPSQFEKLWFLLY